MGRQVAGNGFLRAMVACRDGQALTAFSTGTRAGEAFKAAVAALDPEADTRWISERRPQDLLSCRVLYRPDPILGVNARRRLRVGVNAYSLCGVTHTICTHGTLQAIADYVTDPIMPWDALVSTSQAALTVIEDTLEKQAEMLRWRFGTGPTAPRPMLPIIPLGVHTQDFDFTNEDREEARTGFMITKDEIAILFAGRLSISGKAHPFPMLTALEWAAQTTGRPITLILAGKPQNEATGVNLANLAQQVAPTVRIVNVDGGDFTAYRRTWAAADIFISLADSVQETFGLTPLEAMAAGLPALISDWNGYKETVRDGVEGFRIRTWSPPPQAGLQAALDYDLIGPDHYSTYLLDANMAVVVDMGELRQRLHAMIVNPDLRLRMGAAGKARAKSFEWTAIYRQYQDLWAEQDARRLSAASDPRHRSAPTSIPSHRTAFDVFAHYPTKTITAETQIAAPGGASEDAYRAITQAPFMKLKYVSPVFYANILQKLEGGSLSVGDLAHAFDLPLHRVAEAVAQLAKLDQLILRDPAG